MKLIASTTRWFLAAVGLAALVAWFAGTREWMLAAASAIVLAGIWYLIYRIEIAFHAHSHVGKAVGARWQGSPEICGNRRESGGQPSPITSRLGRSAHATAGETHAGLRKVRRGGVTVENALSAGVTVSGPARLVLQDDPAPLRSRFLYFNPDTGEEIRKCEAV